MLMLVKKAMNGDSEAFLQLMDIHRNTMLRIAHGYFTQNADIADVMQDTILDAYEHLSELRKPQYFKTWLIRILINNCNHIYRSNKKYISLETMPEINQDVSQDLDTPLHKFHELLECVSEENRLCFQLYYGEELTTREISDILHIYKGKYNSEPYA